MKCRKCSLVIAPEDPIIMITCGSPSRFEKCEITWHARCAPMIVRQYVPETKGGFALNRVENGRTESYPFEVFKRVVSPVPA